MANDTENVLVMYNKFSEQVPALFARRQVDNRFFLTICLALFSALGWILKDSCLTVNMALFIKIGSGIGMATAVAWAATLWSYNRALNISYAILREMESMGLPYSLYLHHFEMKKGIWRFFQKFLRHYLIILCFLLSFLFFFLSIAYNWFLKIC